MPWSIVDSGKFAGKGFTLPQIIFQDADWFFYFAAGGKTIYEIHKSEFDDIKRKATRIRIPQNRPEKMSIGYYIHPSSKNFDSIRLVESSRIPNERGFGVSFDDLIDMSFPSRVQGYDKKGCKLLVKDMKEILFGSRSFRMTKQRCEEFFDDSNNFEI